MKKSALLLVLLLPACAITTTGKIRDCTTDYIELGALGYDSLREIHSVCMQVYRRDPFRGPRQMRIARQEEEQQADNSQAELQPKP